MWLVLEWHDALPICDWQKLKLQILQSACPFPLKLSWRNRSSSLQDIWNLLKYLVLFSTCLSISHTLRRTRSSGCYDYSHKSYVYPEYSSQTWVFLKWNNWVYCQTIFSPFPWKHFTQSLKPLMWIFYKLNDFCDSPSVTDGRDGFLFCLPSCRPIHNCSCNKKKLFRVTRQSYQLLPSIIDCTVFQCTCLWWVGQIYEPSPWDAIIKYHEDHL